MDEPCLAREAVKKMEGIMTLCVCNRRFAQGGTLWRQGPKVLPAQVGIVEQIRVQERVNCAYHQALQSFGYGLRKYWLTRSISADNLDYPLAFGAEYKVL